jgi:hypothetical protein
VLEEETPVFGREWAFAVSSLLFKAPPIGFCNHHIFFVFPPLLLLSVVSLCLHLFVGGGGAAGGMIVPASLDTKRTSLRLYIRRVYSERVVCAGRIGRDRESSSVLSLPAATFKLPPLFPLFPPGRQWCEEGHQKTQSTARIGVNQKKSISTLPGLIELVDDCWYTHTSPRFLAGLYTFVHSLTKKIK